MIEIKDANYFTPILFITNVNVGPILFTQNHEFFEDVDQSAIPALKDKICVINNIFVLILKFYCLALVMDKIGQLWF